MHTPGRLPGPVGCRRERLLQRWLLRRSVHMGTATASRTQLWLYRVLPALGCLAVGAASFALSYVALSDEAARVGAVPRGLAFLVPVVIDGGVVCGSAVIWANAHLQQRRARFPFAFVAALVAVSVIVNIAHAASGPLAKAIAALPPLVLLGTLELVATQYRNAVSAAVAVPDTSGAYAPAAAPILSLGGLEAEPFRLLEPHRRTLDLAAAPSSPAPGLVDAAQDAASGGLAAQGGVPNVGDGIEEGVRVPEGGVVLDGGASPSAPAAGPKGASDLPAGQPAVASLHVLESPPPPPPPQRSATRQGATRSGARAASPTSAPVRSRAAAARATRPTATAVSEDLGLKSTSTRRRTPRVIAEAPEDK